MVEGLTPNGQYPPAFDAVYYNMVQIENHVFDYLRASANHN